MNSEQKQLMDELETITDSMDVPEHKRRNPKWLRDNMKTRNHNHPKYFRAMDICTALLKQGVAHN